MLWNRKKKTKKTRVKIKGVEIKKLTDKYGIVGWSLLPYSDVGNDDRSSFVIDLLRSGVTHGEEKFMTLMQQNIMLELIYKLQIYNLSYVYGKYRLYFNNITDINKFRKIVEG